MSDLPVLPSGPSRRRRTIAEKFQIVQESEVRRKSWIGFSARDLGLFEVSCVAEYLSLSPNSIQASMVNWALVINEKATQQLVRMAAVAVDPYGLFDEYARLRRNDFEIEAK